MKKTMKFIAAAALLAVTGCGQIDADEAGFKFIRDSKLLGIASGEQL